MFEYEHFMIKKNRTTNKVHMYTMMTLHKMGKLCFGIFWTNWQAKIDESKQLFKSNKVSTLLNTKILQANKDVIGGDIFEIG